MIKLNGNRRSVRETTADWQYTNDAGDVVVEKIGVRYFSPTVAEVRKSTDERRATILDGRDWYVSDQLASMIESLPDLLDEKGKPVSITAEFLEQQEVLNLKNIAKAIDDDIDPKSKPAK